ncbi:hydrolase Cof [Ammoniphilus oxalaticus]|uniref:Hydrolase Cof n=1 Tax=Ammoniphilus oxalaticus TaxID=66863 RepID=A0A419SKR9_9BACL|nr:Cof-type HAD-IIB family hydrolase [Ammoniphilus oxalaticus]RKD24508.1 hydrolase Cof [Ammoniphilus oxalaticus]
MGKNGEGEGSGLLPYEIVFFDIDGTLLNEQQQIPEDTKAAIRQLQKSSVEVVLATGRAPYHLLDIAEELGIDSHISFNGTYAIHHGRVIHSQPLPIAAVESVRAFAREHNHRLVYLGDKQYVASHQQDEKIEQSFVELELAVPAYDAQFSQTNDVYQIVIYGDQQLQQTYQHQFSELNFVRWHPQAFDVIRADTSKAGGIETLLAHLNISREKAVAFGDGLNDREMLAYVGMGIAMGNAHEELKSLADFTTKHVNDGGITHGLQKIGMI